METAIANYLCLWKGQCDIENREQIDTCQDIEEAMNLNGGSQNQRDKLGIEETEEPERAS